MKSTMSRSVLIAIMLVASASLVAAQARDDVSDRNCIDLKVTSVEQPEAYRTGTFSAKETTDLYFNYLFPRAIQGQFVVTVKLYTPRGYLYRQLDHPVSVGVRAREPEVKLEGYPYPVKVLGSSSATIDGRSVEKARAAFPVAGTSIVSSSLYGNWKAVIETDGKMKTCSEVFEFRITE